MGSLQDGLRAVIVGQVKLPEKVVTQPIPKPAVSTGAQYSIEDYMAGKPLPQESTAPVAVEKPVTAVVEGEVSASVDQGVRTFTEEVIDVLFEMRGSPREHESSEEEESEKNLPRRPYVRGFFAQAKADTKWLMANDIGIREDVYHCCASGCQVKGKLDALTKDGLIEFFVPSPELATAFGINPLEFVMCSDHRNYVAEHLNVAFTGVMTLLSKPQSDEDLWGMALAVEKEKYSCSVPMASYVAGLLADGDLDMPGKPLAKSGPSINWDQKSLSASKGLVADANWLASHFPEFEKKKYVCMHNDCAHRHVAYSWINEDPSKPYFWTLSLEMQLAIGVTPGFYVVCDEHLASYLEWLKKEFNEGSLVLRNRGIYGIPLTEYLISPFLLNEPTRMEFDAVFGGSVPYSKVLALVTSWLPK